jgi:hypothetical protein
MSILANLYNKAFGPLVVTEQEIADAANQGTAAAQEVDAANRQRRDDRAWRAELEELGARFRSVATVSQAERNLAEVERMCAAAVKQLEGQIDAATEERETPYLSRGDDERLKQALVRLGYDLEAALRNQKRRMAWAGQILKDARDYEALRPRYEELRERAKRIDGVMDRAASVESKRPITAKF